MAATQKRQHFRKYRFRISWAAASKKGGVVEFGGGMT
jgi:hypothetical protein